MSEPRPATTPGDRPFQPLLFALAAGMLGHALTESNGHQNPSGMVFLTITLCLTMVAIALPDFGWNPKRLEPFALGVVGAMLAWQFAMLLHNSPGIYLQPRSAWQRLFFIFGVALAGVLAGSGLSDKPLLGKWRMPLLLVVHFLLGCWLIDASPRPIIDVDVMQRDSTNALLHFNNPYQLTFPNIYGNTQFFGTGVADNQRINQGFPYPPLTLLLALPFQALLHDYRYGQLAAMTLAGACMAYARPSRLSAAIATLFIFTPRTFFVLEQGWTDPYLVFLASLTVFVAIRRPPLVPYAFGLLLVSKQYTLIVVLFSWLLVQPFDWKSFGRATARAAAVALAVTLPFVLWSPSAFFFSIGGAYGAIPFRPDALTFPAWLGKDLYPWKSISLIALAGAFGLSAWRAARTPAGFAGAVALLYLGFFPWGGHAFCNHYYFILGLLALAGATSVSEQLPLAAQKA